jgi:hypothetical protein
MAGAEMMRVSSPPHASHVVKGESLNFWIFSIRVPHLLHWYSYKGKATSDYFKDSL